MTRCKIKRASEQLVHNKRTVEANQLLQLNHLNRVVTKDLDLLLVQRARNSLFIITETLKTRK